MPRRLAELRRRNYGSRRLRKEQGAKKEFRGFGGRNNIARRFTRSEGGNECTAVRGRVLHHSTPA